MISAVKTNMVYVLNRENLIDDLSYIFIKYLYICVLNITVIPCRLVIHINNFHA